MNSEFTGSATSVELSINSLIDSLPFYVLLVDEDHYIVLANKAVRTQLDVAPEAIIGQFCPKAVHGVDGLFYACPLEESVKTGKPVELEVQDKDTGRWIRSSIYPTDTFTDKGKKIYFHMVSDITEHRKAEENLKISHQRLRSLSKHLESIREEERKKISHDLHDETSQLLTSMKAYLEAAINTLPANSSETKSLINKAEEHSGLLLDQIHRLVYELRPTIIDDYGLTAAIKWLVANSLEVAKINVAFKSTGKEEWISPVAKITIFRIVQEAINNILKHASARNVSIGLSLKRNTLSLRVQDDGIGFDMDKAISATDYQPRGLGVVGMQERAEIVGGHCEINSSPGHGTIIDLNIPSATTP